MVGEFQNGKGFLLDMEFGLVGLGFAFGTDGGRSSQEEKALYNSMEIGGGRVIALATHLLAFQHRAGSINQMSQNTCHCYPQKPCEKQDFEHHVMERSSDRIVLS